MQKRNGSGRVYSALPTTMTLAVGMVFLGAAPAAAQGDMSCIVQTEVMPLKGRRSPLDSLTFRVGGHEAKICYSRPSSRGRTMIGGRSVPHGKLWRTGANEPTIVRTPVSLSIAGITVPAGTYSIYTVPGETEWEVILNRSYSQWGDEGSYTDKIRAQEVGRGRVPSERTDQHIETFTIRAEEAPGGTVQLILEWERTRVRIPVSAGERMRMRHELDPPGRGEATLRLLPETTSGCGSSTACTCDGW